MDGVTISIYVPTFNHEKYIVRALDSIRMQKTQYSYEVLVGEDCSTDNTRQVVKDWEAAHPDDRFIFFYRQSNMHRSEISNALDLKLRCKGKYLICLEGDDFWTDPLKLQKQASFLETHPDYYAVAHNCVVVDVDSQPNGEIYPECKDEEYTFSHYANNILPGQLATLMARNYHTDENFDRSLLLKRVKAGDRNIVFSILFYGKIHCIQEAMSAYRHITQGGSSYSANYHYDYAEEEISNRYRMEFACRLKNRQAIRCSEYCYLQNIRFAWRTKKISTTRALSDFKNIKHKFPACAKLLVWYFGRILLRISGSV
jgi:glycosyltransferase involved in cell wall biosynthesis